MTITFGRQAGALASTLALTALGLAVAGPATAAGTETDRIGGSDRYATSALISKETFDPGVAVAYLASGVNYPDALAGGAVAGGKGAPVLLTKPDAIPTDVAKELERLKPGKIVVLGGESAVSAAVSTAADHFTDGKVERVAGANRYATSSLLAQSSFSAGVDVAFVASGEDFPDALSGAAAAAKLGGPVLLTKAGDLPLETELALKNLTPGRIVVLGGDKSVSAAVETKLSTISTVDKDVERLEGADRYATSAAISAANFDSKTVYLANGRSFPDALSGAPVAASDSAPILLVKSDAVSQAVCDEINRLQPTTIVALGGTAAVSDSVLAAAKACVDVTPTIDAAATHALTTDKDDVEYNTGDVVTYTMTVKNTSSVTLNVTVTDTAGLTYALPKDVKPVLAPGASATFTAAYTIVANDLGSTVTNTITATGTAPSKVAVSKAVPLSWIAAPVPS